MESLSYNPSNGQFVWTANHPNAKAGVIAGCKKSDGYIGIKVDYKMYQAHRLAWLYMHGEWPDHEIDHINGDRADNRIDNLRDVPAGVNRRNSKRYVNNSSGVSGVGWNKKLSKWVARIGSEHIGVYTHIFEAAAARKSAENRLGFHQNHGRAI